MPSRPYFFYRPQRTFSTVPTVKHTFFSLSVALRGLSRQRTKLSGTLDQSVRKFCKRREETCLISSHDRITFVVNAQVRVNVLAMFLHSCTGDVKLTGNRLLVISTAHERQDFLCTPG